MDKETNVQRVMNMIYSICGCSDNDAIEVLEECKKRIEEKKYIKEI